MEPEKTGAEDTQVDPNRAADLKPGATPDPGVEGGGRRPESATGPDGRGGPNALAAQARIYERRLERLENGISQIANALSAPRHAQPDTAGVPDVYADPDKWWDHKSRPFMDTLQKKLEESQAAMLNAMERRMATYYAKSQDVDEEELGRIIQDRRLYKIAEGPDGDPFLAMDMAMDEYRKRHSARPPANGNGNGNGARPPTKLAAAAIPGSATPPGPGAGIGFTAEDVRKAREDGSYEKKRDQYLALLKKYGLPATTHA